MGKHVCFIWLINKRFNECDPKKSTHANIIIPPQCIHRRLFVNFSYKYPKNTLASSWVIPNNCASLSYSGKAHYVSSGLFEKKFPMMLKTCWAPLLTYWLNTKSDFQWFQLYILVSNYEKKVKVWVCAFFPTGTPLKRLLKARPLPLNILNLSI